MRFAPDPADVTLHGSRLATLVVDWFTSIVSRTAV